MLPAQGPFVLFICVYYFSLFYFSPIFPYVPLNLVEGGKEGDWRSAFVRSLVLMLVHLVTYSKCI